MQCTWKDCKEKATNPQIAKDGEQWANLCDKHRKQLDDSIGKDPSIMLWAWTKAGGGSEKMANRMMKKIDLVMLDRLLKRLKK